MAEWVRVAEVADMFELVARAARRRRSCCFESALGLLKLLK